jgi:two-component sensor histidine kinase
MRTDAAVNVLVVEDSPTDADILRRLFMRSKLERSRSENWQLQMVVRLSEAIAACEQTRVDVVLLDLSLPDSYGLETITEFRTAVPDIPIVILTMSDDDVLALQALSMGAQDYLVKDQVTIQLLMRTIRHAIEREQVLRQLRESERRLHTSLEEKNVLLREVHHRVKNNLQTISSLLRLQAASIQDPNVRDALQESQNRVRVMSLIHEKLYKSSTLTQINFAEYIRDLSADLFQVYSPLSGSICLDVDIDDVELSIETAIPCGLIVNELVCNALQHAFSPGSSGEIKISLTSSTPDHYQLKVQDNGIGLPANFDLRQTRSLGLQIVFALTRQLQGTVNIEQQHGTIFQITFKNITVK